MRARWRLAVAAGAVVLACSAMVIYAAYLGRSRDGAANADTPAEDQQVTLSLEPELERIVMEAESAEVVSPMQVFQDDTASGGGYVMTPEPPDNDRQTAGGEARFTLNISKPGAYFLWLRVYWNHSCDNSLWVRLNGTDLGNVTNGTYGHWQWMQVGREPLLLKTGRATLTIGSREDESKLDQIMLAEAKEGRTYVPVGAEGVP